MFSKFFIKRPRFAVVISLFLIIGGIVCALMLPIKQYPDVAPPQVSVWATYPGADAQTLANTVGIPLEEAVNGVEGMIYMSSTSSSNGSYSLNVTFRPGTNSDMALVKVQNRIQQASALLPSEVAQQGITTEVAFSNTLGFLALVSPNGTRDEAYLTNYANSNVKNTLSRIQGMGKVEVLGAQYSIRVWVDPDRLAALGLSTSDVADAIASQNRQAALGSVGGSPGSGPETPMTYALTAAGRLTEARQFEDIVLKRTEAGAVVTLKDVARVELGSEAYDMSSFYAGRPCAIFLLSQGADANALDVMRGVKQNIEEMRPNLPEDVDFVVVHDTTDFVVASLYEILQTLALTFSLVVLVCYLFLQDWRVTLVPAAAIPVSVLATFIGLLSMGYSINTFTLFGLVLVIGTVVDDAIVVVERVLYVMEHQGLDAPAATEQAMKDVGGSLIATTLIFLAIFVPITFLSGITGEIYRQFGVAMSFAVVISTTVAFTLSPAICAHLLSGVRPRTRGPLAWFNKMIGASTGGFVKGSMWIARRALVLLLLMGILCGAVWYVMGMTPTSFIPDEDQGAILGGYQLPEGASRARAHELLSELLPRLGELDGVANVMGVEGFSFIAGEGENVGAFLLVLDNWSQRRTPDLELDSILEKVEELVGAMPEASINAFSMAGIPGLGTTGGLELRLQATMDPDPLRLEGVMQQFLGRINMAEEVLYAFCTYTADTPQVFVDVDRLKAERMGVPLGNVFDTLQTYFGTAYINDVNLGTEVNKVIVQSDWAHRDRAEAVERAHIRGASGQQVPMRSLATLRRTLAPRSISRYNLYPSAEITVMMAPGYSSGQGMELVSRLARDLPEGYTYSWTGQTYQEQEAAGQFGLVILAAVVFGYLFLVAQYESWSAPMAVMLSLPAAVLGALIGIWVMGIDLSIYTELGILLLVGLASKNAILIVEFAKEQREERGLSILDSAARAAGERFRSVLMTAFTCVLGVAPMVVATGAGAVSRIHVGTTMFFGMTIATVFGIFLIPGLYVLMQSARERVKAALASLFMGRKEETANEG